MRPLRPALNLRVRRHGTVAVWSQYTDTVTTQCVLLPCGYGTPIQCPHVWLPCGHGIPTPCQHRGYSCHAATVHEHRAHLVQIPWPHGDRTPRGGTVAMACVTATVPNLWHGVRVPCPHGNCTYHMATACVYRGHTATIHGVWHWHRATTVATVTVRPRYMDTLPTWYRHRGHTVTIHHVVARWPCTMSTRQLYIPCGHSVGVPWPHSNCTYCLGTDIVPTPCLRLPCGHSTWTPCLRLPCGHSTWTLCLRLPCGHGTWTPCLWLPCGHGTWTPCPLGVDTMATRQQPYILSGHGYRANTMAMVAVRPQYTDTVPTCHRYHGHTETAHRMVARWLCTVSTRQLYIPCAHGARVPWPHGDCTSCLGTISVYRSHMDGRRGATVHGHLAHLV